jgi:phosphoglycolate phosphatase-like HAD superfamily hydrolase
MNRAARAVIFDYDGTLVDTAEAFLESINTALENAHLRNTTMREISSMDLREIITSRTREMRSSTSVEQVFDSIWEAFADTLRSPFPLRVGAAQTLRELSHRGIGLALISKRGGRAGLLPLNELRAAGLETLFRLEMVGVDLTEYGAALSKALEALRTQAKETIVVSDWCKDIEYASGTGLMTVGIVGGVSDKDEHRKAGANWVVKTLTEIPRIPTIANYTVRKVHNAEK